MHNNVGGLAVTTPVITHTSRMAACHRDGTRGRTRESARGHEAPAQTTITPPIRMSSSPPGWVYP
jgi:hypothetical protein